MENERSPATISTWLGRNIETLNRSELIKVIEFLSNQLKKERESHPGTLSFMQLTKKMTELKLAIISSCQRLRSTLGNKQWMDTNQALVKNALPTKWTSAENSDFLLCFGFTIKCLGVEWRDKFDLIVALYWLAKIGICEARKDPHADNSNPYCLIIRKATN